MKILHIEDDETIANLFGKLVRSVGHKYTTTPNGKWALEILESDDYDVILLDLSMPEFSGFDFVKEFRERIPNKNCSIIVLSALDISKDNEETLRNLGVTTFVQKPISLSNILDVLENEKQKLVTSTPA